MFAAMEKEPTTPDGRTPRQPEEQSAAGVPAEEAVVGEDANGIADNRGRVMVEEVGSNGGNEDEGEVEEQQEEQDVTTASARAMPVAKPTAEDEEDEEEVEDDEDEDDDAAEEEEGRGLGFGVFVECML